MKKNIAIICGGGGSEHDISIISSKHILNSLKSIGKYNVLWLELTKDGHYVDENKTHFHFYENIFKSQDTTFKIDFAIPYMHGYPGETGDFQSILEINKIPYLGPNPEGNLLCFNKGSTKLWMSYFNIPNTPFKIASNLEEALELKTLLKEWPTVFIKASSQGSSVGCYKVSSKNADQFEKLVKEAFTLSPYVLFEKGMNVRELECSVFEWNGQIVCSLPGEIVTAKDTFYSFEEKYSQTSKAETFTIAENISNELSNQIREIAIKAFKLFKLKHLSRVDFFLNDSGELYLNEINTLPGMTPISMFPKMMEAHGVDFKKWLEYVIESETNV